MKYTLIVLRTICYRVDEMIRNVESFEGKTHLHQVTMFIDIHIIHQHANISICARHLLGSLTFRVISERWDCHARSSRWRFKNIFGHFYLPDFMGKRAERW